MPEPQINLVAAWIGILLGFVSGMLMGLFFHREEWLGGYNSFKRRLYRLAHISFFGLGVVNLCFFFTVRALTVSESLVTVASYCLLAGAVGMPLCCVAMAHYPRTHLLFGVPVLSLLAGGLLTLLAVMRTDLSPKIPVATSRPSIEQNISQDRRLNGTKIDKEF